MFANSTAARRAEPCAACFGVGLPLASGGALCAGGLPGQRLYQHQRQHHPAHRAVSPSAPVCPSTSIRPTLQLAMELEDEVMEEFRRRERKRAEKDATITGRAKTIKENKTAREASDHARDSTIDANKQAPEEMARRIARLEKIAAKNNQPPTTNP